jgi:hypothetical protein
VQTGATPEVLVLVLDRPQILLLQTLLMLTTGLNLQVSRMVALRLCQMEANAHATTICAALLTALDHDQVSREHPKPVAGLTTR